MFSGASRVVGFVWLTEFAVVVNGPAGAETGIVTEGVSVRLWQ